MSGTPPRAHRRPLHERSGSHTNALAGIRIVPYSPPRPLSITSSHRRDASSSDHGLEVRSPGTQGACASSPPADLQGARDRDSRGEIAAHQPHHALGAAASSTSSRALATVRGHGVSGPNVPSHRRNRSSGRRITLTTPDRAEAASPTRTNARDISQLHASSYSEEPSNITGVASPGRPVSRRRNLITVHTGKGTFAIQPQSTTAQGHGHGTFKSPSLSLSLSTQSSFERLSDLFSSDGRPSTPLSTLPERTPSPCTSLESPSSRLLGGDLIAGSSSSPWNYRLVGGLRKVPATPDHPKQNHAQPQPRLPATLSSPSKLSDTQPPSTPRDTTPIADAPPESPRSLLNKASFQSSQSDSTASGETNYKVYGASSPAPANDTLPDADSLRAPSSSDSSSANYHILGHSSPAPSSLPPSSHLSPTRTIAAGDPNFSLLSDLSPRASDAAAGKIRPEYSRESLIVPPLQPIKKKLSFEEVGLRKTRSRESFRTGSLTSINSFIGQEAIQAFLSTPLVLRRPSDASGFSSLGADPWAPASSELPAPNPPMQAHPHQWSSQLSTVPSESEGASEPVSRSASPRSSSGWRSSGYQGSHSRQMLSISSSLAAHEEDGGSQSQSLSDSLDRPQPVLSRGATVRLVQDHDEHGDGLAELHDFYPSLHQRPSRRRLASLLSSSSSDRNLHSSASSRSGSIHSASIPTWARLYYGSGERRWLRHVASTDSMATDSNDGGSRPSSSFRTGSPSAEHLPLNIYSPRRRPREVRLPPAARPDSNSGSLGSNTMPPAGVLLRSTLRRQTSSIWSPHLARDQRASGYSIWEPPSINWSTESGPLGRRNIQIVLFILGFILPLSWMVGACLPLPPKPRSDMLQQPSDSVLEASSRPTRANLAEEIAYYNTRWWRNLNRIMAVIGFFIITIIIVLVVVGINQGWGA